MKIYTKTGDKGQTGLWGGNRVPKSDQRVGAYGEVDELNCCLGATLSYIGKEEVFTPLRQELLRIQAELFTLGAILSSPTKNSGAGKSAPSWEQELPEDVVTRLEGAIDSMTAQLSPLSRFILPGGGACGAWLHLARAVCRRAERETVRLSLIEDVPERVIVYLNRLSDYLFTAARWVNAKAGQPETEWQGLPKKNLSK